MKGFRTILFLLWLAVPAGCVRSDGDRENCPTGVRVRFYSQSPCGGEMTWPEVTALKLYVFSDQSGMLVAWQEDDRVVMNPEYTQSLALGAGTYTLIAWAELGFGPYLFAQPITHSTTRTDLLFRLRQQAGEAVDIEGSRIWVGESLPVEVSDAGGLLFAETEINLLEITNRISVRIEGLSRPEDYQIVIEADDGAMTFEGNILPGDLIRYTGITEVVEPTSRAEGGLLETRFTTLKLEPDSEYASDMVITDYTDPDRPREIFRADLIEELLLKCPDVDLACGDHDFDVVFKTEEFDTYIAIRVWVNGWLVHSYSKDL